MQTIVIGHRNPDMDSICSAIAYARLKQLQGVEDVVAARAGNTNARIDYVLQRFGFPAPMFLSDASPRVADVMQRDVVSIRADAAVYDAIQLIGDKELRGLPVIDANNHCLGLLSSFRLSHYMFPRKEQAGSARVVVASLANIVATFGGTVMAGEVSREAKDTVLVVGAMDLKTFLGRMEKLDPSQVVLFVGNREHIQMAAIEANAKAVVVTGGLPIENGIKREAKKRNVVLVSSPYDTATSVLLARGAAPAERMIEPFTSFTPDTPLELAREKASQLPSFIFPIIDGAGLLVGVLSKSDFIKPAARRLILVDHNELSQAVPGADKVPIIEILDHHRIGGFSSEAPIHFWNNPVGSTSTIVALCYEQAGVPIPQDIAGLLMAGLVSDTLNLTSPTATPVDAQTLKTLSKIAGVNPKKFAEEIFSVGSPLLTMDNDQVIASDCKEYEVGGRRFSVSQIEELNFSHLEEKEAGLLKALDRHCRNRGLFFAALLVTDVNTQNSILLGSGAPALWQRIDFPAHGPQMWTLNGIVSRKKQLLPYLLERLSGVSGNGD
jgi:manganese-dependent inorganic pyrophosphatase